jgi:outer membrane lipoprotein-sorting protein
MNNENIEEILKDIGAEEIPADVHKIAQETSNNFSSSLRQTKQSKRHILLEQIMKSNMTKLAAAAVIIITVLIGIYQFVGSAPAFAEVIEPILTARTASYKITINLKGAPTQTRDCMFMEPGRTRQVLPSGVIRVKDKPRGKEMDLYPAEKKAIIYEMTNIPEDKQGSNNWFQRIRECIRQAQQTEDESVTFLGKQKINGARAFGYRIVENSNLTDMTVWADAETLLPTWIEYSIDSTRTIIDMKGTIIFSDIVFNEELDESLFSMEVPEGYESQSMKYDYEPSEKPGEEDLIRALSLWSDKNGGKFPSELNMKAAVELLQLLEEKMGLVFEKGKAQDISNPNLHEFYRIRRRIQHGVGFVQKLFSESDWHYAGKDVKLGEAEKPICWYRPEGSETYRVIYGDLSVKEVLQKELPR